MGNIDNFEFYFDKLVPAEGAANTIEGEMLRSASRMCYRWYNDGDYFYEGYGIETAGVAFIYLKNVAKKRKINKLYTMLRDLQYSEKREDEYAEALEEVCQEVIKYIESRNENYRKNEDDLHNYYEEAVECFGDPYGDPYEDEDEYEDYYEDYYD